MKNEDIDNAIACLRALAEDKRVPEAVRIEAGYHASEAIFKLLQGDRPNVAILCTDRFAIPMLTTRKLLLEEHCLMAEARKVAEQIREITEWQVAHLGLLTPLPGTVPANVGPTDDWR